MVVYVHLPRCRRAHRAEYPLAVSLGTVLAGAVADYGRRTGRAVRDADFELREGGKLQDCDQTLAAVVERRLALEVRFGAFPGSHEMAVFDLVRRNQEVAIGPTEAVAVQGQADAIV